MWTSTTRRQYSRGELRYESDLSDREWQLIAMWMPAQNRLGRFDDAIASFETAKKFQSRNPVLYNNLAYALGKKGDTDGQIAALKQAIAIRPSYVTARYNLGMAYLARGMRERALAESRALEKFDEGAAASLRKAVESGKH